MSDLVTEARRREEQLAKQRRWIAKLFDDRRKARAEVTRLRDQFAALADQLDHEDEDAEFPKYDPDGYQALSDAANRIRRILEGDP